MGDLEVYWSRSYCSLFCNYLCNQCLSPLKLWVRIMLMAWCSTQYVQHSVIKFCQWFVAGWWFSPGTQVSSTIKTDHHDITENLNQSKFVFHRTLIINFHKLPVIAFSLCIFSKVQKIDLINMSNYQWFY